MYNLVVPRKKDSPYKQLFRTQRMGKKIDMPESEKAGVPDSLVVRLTGSPGPEGDEEAGDGWSYSRWLDARRGELYHEILSEIEYIDDSPVESISAAADKRQSGRVSADDTDSTKEDLVRFLSDSQVREWFQQKPGRTVFCESDFIDSSGKLLRMDRVIVDTDSVTVIDFKTGEPKDYSKQLGCYTSLLEELYPDRKIEAYLAYVDSGRVEGPM
jgi:hypothetical protein